MPESHRELEGDRTQASSIPYSNLSPITQRPSPSRRSTAIRSGDVANNPSFYETADSGGTVRRMDTEHGTVDQPSERVGRSEGQQASETSRTSSVSSSRRGITVPQDQQKIRKPPMMNRRVSNLPSGTRSKRGFSVDDNESEVEEDLQNKRSSHPLHPSTSYSQIRRQSLLRRRTTVGTLASAHDNDAEDSGEDEIPGGLDENDDANADAHGASYASSEAESVESFTLKDRQQAINETHPFGIRIWKPALYKKDRSVQRTAEGDIHSTPGAQIGALLGFANILWVVLFGWWLALVCLVAGLSCCLIFTPSAITYARVFFGLSWYIFYPFGNFVELEQEEAYLEEDEGEGRSIGEYEQWQAGDLEGQGTFFGPLTPRSIVGRRRASIDSATEADPLLGSNYRTGAYSGTDSPLRAPAKRRLFGRGDWNIGRIIFFAWFYSAIAPLLLIVSIICWWLVFTIPMAKVTSVLVSHLRRHPLALSFHSSITHARRSSGSPSILLCTYRAVGWKYYKYTIDGTNIFFINLMSVVIFVIVDHYILAEMLDWQSFITASSTIFTLALFSVIPLAYFIGQAVASISAQSSMGMGATINAFFSTVVEVFLYIVALDEGKGRLVEGSIVGSILAGILFMPGVSMCSGAFVRKTQKFNARSAGVTSTMLLFAIIGAFAPTLFYQIYGTYELSCSKCTGKASATDCQRCVFSQIPAATDRFYYDAVLPFTYLSAMFLFISYAIGLWFTLRTHAAVIWQVSPTADVTHPQGQSTIALSSFHRHRDAVAQSSEADHTRPGRGMRDSQLYKRILGQSLSGVGLRQDGAVPTPSSDYAHIGHSMDDRESALPRERISEQVINDMGSSENPVSIPGLSSEQNARIVRGVAEVAAAAATAAVQSVHREREVLRPAASKTLDLSELPINQQLHAGGSNPPVGNSEMPLPTVAHDPAIQGGHDAPNWGKIKSAVILLGATILYAIIAEILVKTVDVVLENVDIDEKFLGITLFALVPNTTEFLNAISFAMNGNIALSMEIGSAYALQVCLLQIPALVAWSAYSMGSFPKDKILTHTFTLIFPQWDLVTVILCVFLLSYIYAEGKSNYFKGSILILSYFTVMLGFFFSSYADIPVGARSKTHGVGSRANGYNIEVSI